MLKRGVHQFYSSSSSSGRHRLVVASAAAGAAGGGDGVVRKILRQRLVVRLAQQRQQQQQQLQNHDYYASESSTLRLKTTTRFFSSTSGGDGGGGGDDEKGSGNPSLEDIIQSLDAMHPKQHQHEESKQAPRPMMEKEESSSAATAAGAPPPPPTTAHEARQLQQPPKQQDQQQQQQSYRSPYTNYSSSPYSSNTTQQPRQEENKQQQQKIDWSKKVGRGWKDPWNPIDLLEASLNAGNNQQQPGLSSASSSYLLSSSRLTYDDLPDWSPKHVSRAALDHVHVHADKIPSLATLSKLPLPPPPAYAQPGLYPGQYVALAGYDNNDSAEQIQKQHTRNKRLYGRHREQHLYRQVRQKVKLLAEPQVPAIVALHDWHDKQNAIDDLFESIELQLQQSEVILGKHPSLGKWVERALEEYLASLVAAAAASPTAATASTGGGGHDDESSKNSNLNESSDNVYPAPLEDAAAVPVFMDCQDDDSNPSSSSKKKSSNSTSDIFPVPILRPLRPYERAANQGRMIEEWELAAHDTTKRILLRQSTRQVARILTEHYESTVTTNNNTTTSSTATNTNAESSSSIDETTTIIKTSSSPSPRILVTGRQGVGKTAALASIVASARKSGHVVWYMPDCNQLHQNGYYIEPNEKNNNDDERESKLYDLPVLSQQACRDFHASHGMDLQKHNLKASAATLQMFFTKEQLDHIPGASGTSNDDISIPLSDLLKLGLEKPAMGPMCLSTVVHVLMHEQDAVPFTIVADEFNVLYAPGKYFHQDYDESVKTAIPYDQITLFRPILQAMGLPNSSISSDKKIDPITMKRGAIVAGLTESCAVARQVTDTLVALAQHEASLLSSSSSSLHVVDIPRLTDQEVYCMLANYEAIGIGKLRLDQGETILNPQEVAFLQTVSGSVPQLLMNACIL